MPELILQRVEECYAQAEKYFNRHFPRPGISLDLRGQSAGAAYPQRNLLRFNAGLYLNNKSHFLQQTVAHEVAHLLVCHVYGLRVRPHGVEWQGIMQEVFGLPAHRCHQYQLAPVWRTLYSYSCRCRQHEFTSQRHTRAKRGSVYQCRVCRQTLEFTGRQQRTLVER